MPLIAYPVASDASAALGLLRQGKAPRASREKEAEAAVARRVVFTTEGTGPVFETREDGLKAYAGLVEDDRPGHIFLPAAEDQFCALTCRIKPAGGRKAKPMQPVFKDGQRWPAARKPPATVWQLSLSYWKIVPAQAAAKPAPILSTDQARHLRKKARGESLTPEEVLELAHSPLTAARPQKALDFGLFDYPLPENPGIIIADE